MYREIAAPGQSEDRFGPPAPCQGKRGRPHEGTAWFSHKSEVLAACWGACRDANSDPASLGTCEHEIAYRQPLQALAELC